MQREHGAAAVGRHALHHHAHTRVDGGARARPQVFGGDRLARLEGGGMTFVREYSGYGLGVTG